MTRPEQPANEIGALIRDAGSGYYPARIGVFCDRCGRTAEHDYLVHESQDRAARFAVARAHLTKNENWTCDDNGDHCPDCTSNPTCEATR